MRGDYLDCVDRLRGAKNSIARWDVVKDILSCFGGDWVTGGSAPKGRITNLAIQSSTSHTLMQDYIAKKLHEHDPWIAHSSMSPDVLECSIQFDRLQPPDLDMRMVSLFRDHGVRHVCLLPSWADERVGAIVLYARESDTADQLSRMENRSSLRCATALVAAFWRPDQLENGEPEHYRLASPLSLRETETLTWLAAGLRTDAIAYRMDIEYVTVSKHLEAARRKLGARTREQALAIAVRDGLVRP